MYGSDPVIVCYHRVSSTNGKSHVAGFETLPGGTRWTPGATNGQQRSRAQSHEAVVPWLFAPRGQETETVADLQGEILGRSGEGNQSDPGHLHAAARGTAHGILGGRGAERLGVFGTRAPGVADLGALWTGFSYRGLWAHRKDILESSRVQDRESAAGVLLDQNLMVRQGQEPDAAPAQDLDSLEAREIRWDVSLGTPPLHGG